MTIQNIYMMGFMGCGKTKVGRIVAELMNWDFLDTDACIVEDAGKAISDIFEQNGEPHFRTLEKKWIQKASLGKNQVISLGGGAVVDAENWNIISSTGVTVNLSYPPSIIAARLARKSDRPLLNTHDQEKRLSQINALMEKRKEFYQRADFIFHINQEQPAEQVAGAITALLGVHS